MATQLTAKQEAGRAELRASIPGGGISPLNSQVNAGSGTTSGNSSSGSAPKKLTMAGGNPTGATFAVQETAEEKQARLKAGVFMNPQTGAYTDQFGNPSSYNGNKANASIGADYEAKVQSGIYKPAGTVVNSAGAQIGTQSAQQGVNAQGQNVAPNAPTYTPNAPKTTETPTTDWTQQLGELKDTFTKQLETLQSRTGITADTQNPEMQKEILAAQAEGTKDFMPIIRKYMQGGQVTDEELQGLKSQAIAGGLSEAEAQGAMDASTQNGITKFSKEELAQYYKKFIPKTATGETPMLTENQTIQQGLADQMPNKNPSAGYTDDIVPESTPTDKSIATLNNIGGMDLNSLNSTLNSLGVDFTKMNSAEMMQLMMLQSSNNIADDPTTMNFLMKNAQSALNAFNSGMNLAEISMSEIDKAISGADFAPVTLEGLSAKVYTQSKEMNLESIENEKAYQKTQYDVWMSQETDKRSRLEGYLKAKLYAAGAQDSLAGLSTMALAVNAADLNIQLKQAEYNYGLSKLNIESRQIMTNYANSIVELGMNVESKKGTLMDTYDTKMTEIEGLAIADTKEKAKMKLSALSTFVEKMTALDRQKIEDARYEEKIAYEKTKDSIDTAFKLSGLTGSIYGVDDKGQLFDTNIDTFEAKKWQDTQWLDQMKFQHTMENDSWDKAFKGLDTYGSSFAPYAEQMLNMPSGSLSNLSTIEEQKQAANSYLNGALFGGQFQQSTGNIDYVTAQQNYGGKELISLGIPDFDPMNLQEVKQGFQNLGGEIKKVTQGFDTKVSYLKGRSTHGGYDIVFNDGEVHSLTGGVITEIIPDPNPGVKKGWGARVRVQDSQGNVYQYAHFNTDNVQVRVGDRINMGDSLGLQGSAGYSTGAHTDFRLIGTGVPPAESDDNVISNAVDYITSLYRVNTDSQTNAYSSPSTPKYGATFSDFQNSFFQTLNSPSGAALLAPTLKNMTPQESMTLALMNQQWQNQNSDWTSKQNLKQLSSTDIGRLSSATTAVGQLNELKQDIVDNYDLFGPVTGRLQKYNPYATRTQSMQSVLLSTMQVVGKYMEEGVLRKEDEEKYARMLPSITDTPQVAMNKIDNVMEVLNTKYQEYYTGYKDSGYDIGGYSNALSFNQDKSVQVIDENGDVYVYDDPNDSNLKEGLDSGYFQPY